LQFLKGINESIIIDDSYNASPLSMKMAIETVHSIKAKRKVAIIGDMLELGEFAKEAHKEIGALAGKVFDVVVGVGSESAVYASEALKARLAKKNSISVLTVEEILPQLATIIKPGDLVLVKASHGVHLSRVVEAVREEAGKES
jgi:UDP-N-acetylmuramoyl-tripeptide--D-alanyl-D-alanine ligase